MVINLMSCRTYTYNKSGTITTKTTDYNKNKKD